jgi:hypothetical protein
MWQRQVTVNNYLEHLEMEIGAKAPIEPRLPAGTIRITCLQFFRIHF